MRDKKELLKLIMTLLAKNEIEEADKLIKLFLDNVHEITAEEVSNIAQQLDDEGVFSDANQHDIIEKKVFEVIDTKIPQKDLSSFQAGHPIHTFLKENSHFKELIERAKHLLKENNSFTILRSDWLMIAKQFRNVNIHYLRKENQLFPFLEKRGFSHPSTIMWSVHDKTRAIAKDFNRAVEENKEKRAREIITDLCQEVFQMTVKEERILLPKSSRLLTINDWEEIRAGEDEIGWVIPEPPQWNAKSGNATEGNPYTNAMPAQSAEPVYDAEVGVNAALIGAINLEVGAITPEMINLIFKHMPFDVTYVDQNDEVRYYNKGEERVFPRSPGIIGRLVKYCHPPKSVHIVEKIVDAFKKGERNEANFWINIQGKFVYIQYFAVRDSQDNYKGVLEITYDATTVRSLKGEQRLLDWK